MCSITLGSTGLVCWNSQCFSCACAKQEGLKAQGLVAYMLPVDVFATGIKIFDQ